MENTYSMRELTARQKAFFYTGKTKDLRFREAALLRLEQAILKYEKDICRALKADLHKAPFESYMSEIGMTLSELSYMKKHMRGWARRRQVPTPIAQFPAKSFVEKEPYGCVLVMAPWNYPFMLCMEPLIGALAAGNCCVVKPSNYAPATARILKQLLEEIFPPEYVTVVLGGREENQALLSLHFDYIFFTGGKTVGRLVMEKAAKHLTPVTLELGGKSPCIIDETADLKLAARRLAFGKFLNAGQTCVAPDYLLIQERVKEPFLQYLEQCLEKMYGKNPLDNPNYPRIVNRKHYDRLLGLMEEEQIFLGGACREETLQIAPTVLTGVTRTSKSMQEEIFGPILPVLTFRELLEAEEFVLEGEKPLALYLFTRSRKNEREVLQKLSFGGGCINDTIIHLATSHMGFGGVGASGMGSYHGKKSFDTFTHEKSMVKKSGFLDLPIRYHPYSGKKEKLLRLFLK